MNNALLALLFVIYCSGSSSEDDLGQLRHAYAALCDCPARLDISRLLTWVMFISPWAQPHRQHDAAEFVQHIAPRIRSPVFSGVWRDSFAFLTRALYVVPSFSP